MKPPGLLRCRTVLDQKATCCKPPGGDQGICFWKATDSPIVIRRSINIPIDLINENNKQCDTHTYIYIL